MPDFQPPKGMKDIMPDEMAKRKWMYAKIRKVLDARGYSEIEPSALEDMKTLTAKSGEDVKNEIYCFTDKGGRELGMRFDLTVGLARIAATNPVAFPFKAYCISNMWRYDNPQFGRYRSFWQWDIEVFGAGSAVADAEIIAAGINILKALGLPDFEVRINNRMLVEGMLEYVGIKEDKMDAAMRTIDKLHKISKKQLVDEFKRNGLTAVQAEEIINAVSRRGEMRKVLAQICKDYPQNGRTKAGVLALDTLSGALKALGVSDVCVLDVSVVRGLGYYTGTVFEAVDSKTPELGSLFGGGRYDNLAEIYGRKMPACGVAGGIERTMAALDKRGVFSDSPEGVEYFVAAVNETVRADALAIAEKLLSGGKSVQYDMMARKLRDQLECANKIGAKKAIIVGPKELERGNIVVRDLKSGKERECKLHEA